MNSFIKAIAAVGYVTGMVEGALRSSHHSLIAPQVLQGMMRDAEVQWISGYRGALNGTANATAAMNDVRGSCVTVAIAMVNSVKGHKNGLQKRMKTICKMDQSDDLCDTFSSGLIAAVSANATTNIDGTMDGSFAAFCGHFIEAQVRPKAEARNIAAKELENKAHDRQARIAATMKVVAKAQEEVKKAQTAQHDELKAVKPTTKKSAKSVPQQPSPSQVEARKQAEMKAKQEAAEREGGAKGLEKELAQEEDSENGVKGQVVKDALAVEAIKAESPSELKH
jgi:hypothetical protein